MLKIETLKVDDKLYCIKTQQETGMIYRTLSYYERRRYFLSKFVKDLTKEEKLERKNFDFRDEEIYDNLIEHKTYTITHKIDTEITVTSERTEIIITSDITKSKIFKDENFLNEHFITDKERRKRKLQSISDNTFSSYFKKNKNENS